MVGPNALPRSALRDQEPLLELSGMFHPFWSESCAFFAIKASLTSSQTFATLVSATHTLMQSAKTHFHFVSLKKTITSWMGCGGRSYCCFFAIRGRYSIHTILSLQIASINSTIDSVYILWVTLLDHADIHQCRKIYLENSAKFSVRNTNYIPLAWKQILPLRLTCITN